MSKRIELMKNGNMVRSLLVLGIPSIISMMISSIYNLVDAIYIGRLGTEAISAITIILPIVMILSGVASIFGMGSSSLLSRQLGEGDKKNSNTTASIALFTNAVIGAVLVILVSIFKTDLLRLFGAKGIVLDFANDYAGVAFIGTFVMYLNIIMYNVLRAEGNTLKPLLAAGGTAVLNVILNPILMFGFDMGITGAASATLISQIVAFSILSYGFLKKQGLVQISLSYFKFSKDIYKEVIKMGMIAFLFQLLTGVGLTLLNSAANDYGASAVAAMGIVGRILGLGLNIVFGFTQGFQPIAGYNYGAKNYKRVKEAIISAITLSTAFSLIFAIIISFGAKLIARIFSSNDVVIDIVQRAMLPNSIAFISYGLIYVVATGFIALGMGKEGGMVTLFKQGILFIPLVIVLPMLFGLDGVIYAQPIADLLSLIIVIISGKSLFNRLDNNEKKIRSCIK